MQRRRHKALEVSGRSVEDAIANGLAQLAMSQDEVSIEILDRGSRGLLGLGAEPARVRILYPVEEGKAKGEMGLQRAEEELTSEEMTQVIVATVNELLDRMGIHAHVTVQQPQSDEPLTLNISGEDLSVLIGPQGETLNSLQYVARLIASRELLRWVAFFLDVDGYRQRRAAELQDLARRMAERVALNKQPLALQPMPAHERRIIHIALRSHPLATTQSVGEGEHRRVTILPRV